MFGIEVNSFEVKNFFVQKIGKSTFVWRGIEFLQGLSYSLNYLSHYRLKLFKKTSITEINIGNNIIGAVGRAALDAVRASRPNLKIDY